MALPAGALQHVVLLNFSRELSSDEHAELARQIRAWPEEIGGFLELRFGRDLTGNRTRGYEYLLFQAFPNEASLKAYLTHPAHRAFGDWVHERGCVEIAFDYFVDQVTAVVPAV